MTLVCFDMVTVSHQMVGLERMFYCRGFGLQMFTGPFYTKYRSVYCMEAPHSMAVGQYGSVVHTHTHTHTQGCAFLATTLYTNVYTHTHFACTHTLHVHTLCMYTHFASTHTLHVHTLCMYTHVTFSQTFPSNRPR